MAKSPAFQFYAGDFLSDEDQRLMTLEEVGAYIRLIASEWKEGSLPDSLRKLARLCSCSNDEMERIWPEIGPKFIPHPEFEGRLIHTRNQRERDRQQARSSSASDAAAVRWAKERERRRIAELRGNGANARSNNTNACKDDANGMPFIEDEVEVEVGVGSKQKKGTRRKRTTYPPEFEEIWALHPRGPKWKAHDEWVSTHKPDQEIQDALASYIRHEINERFSGHDLFRWIRDERWEQEESRTARHVGPPTAEAIGEEIDKLGRAGML